MGEFVAGFDELADIGAAVTIFGSARSQPGDPMYDLAVETSRRLGKQGFSILTGDRDFHVSLVSEVPGSRNCAGSIAFILRHNAAGSPPSPGQEHSSQAVSKFRFQSLVVTPRFSWLTTNARFSMAAMQRTVLRYDSFT